MGKKQVLLEKLYAKGIPKNFTVRELDTLMAKCNCEKFSGGRGSSIGYYHPLTKLVVQFDAPHPEKELYTYQIKMVRGFLKDIGEYN